MSTGTPDRVKTRWWVVAVGGLVAVVAAGVMLDQFYRGPDVLPPDDFLEYWAAGRLATSGGNPYDPDAIFRLQQQAGRTEDYATIMWSPPWSLTLAIPFGLVDARTGQLLWIALQMLGVLAAVDYLWRVYGGRPDLRWAAWLVAMSPLTTGLNVTAGQSSGWLLIGLVGFLAAVVTRRPGWAVLAALCAHKPHLFLPFWIVLVLDATRSRSAAARFGWGVAAGLFAIAVPLAVDPDVWGQYFALTSAPPVGHPGLKDWQPPLLGFWARTLIGGDRFWVQLIPTAILMVATPVYWWVRRSGWDWTVELPVLVLAGLIAAPYGAWPFDLMLLYVPVVAAAARLSQTGNRRGLVVASVGYGLVQATVLIPATAVWYFWVAPLVAAGYAWAIRSARH